MLEKTVSTTSLSKKDIEQVIPQRLELGIVPSRQQVVPPHLDGIVPVPGLSPLPHLSGDVFLNHALHSFSPILNAVIQVSAARPHERCGGAPGQWDAFEHCEVSHDPVGGWHHHHAVLSGRVPGKAANLAFTGLHASLDDGGLRLVANGCRSVLHVVQADDVAVTCQCGQQAGTCWTPRHLKWQERNTSCYKTGDFLHVKSIISQKWQIAPSEPSQKT